MLPRPESDLFGNQLGLETTVSRRIYKNSFLFLMIHYYDDWNDQYKILVYIRIIWQIWQRFNISL